MKTCNRCHLDKPEDEFNKRGGTGDGLDGHCKICHNDGVARYCLEHPTKICSGCGTEKSLDEFHKSKTTRDGRTVKCIACKREYAQKYFAENRTSIDEKNRVYRQEHRDEDKQRRSEYYHSHKEESSAKSRVYYQKNKEIINARNRLYYKNNKEYIIHRALDRRHGDPVLKLSLQIRTRLRKALKGSFKVGSTVRDLGCTIPEFRVYLEKQFRDGMTWGNQGGRDGWQLDHKKPLAAFDLTNRKEFLKAVHYTNYQPLPKVENLTKNSVWRGLLIRRKARPAMSSTDSVLAYPEQALKLSNLGGSQCQ